MAVATIRTGDHSGIAGSYNIGMDEMVIFRRNPAALIKSRGYSMLEMERRSGISRTHIKLVLDGDRELTIKRASILARVFGLKARDMLTESLPDAGTAQENHLLDKYRHTTEQGRAALISIADQLPDADNDD